MPGGPDFVAALQRCWERGDAIAPIDLRLPSNEIDRVMAALRPGAVIEADGERRALDGGQPIEPGDAAVVATSGTSGEPKGVIHTHRSVAASADATSKALAVDPTTDRWLACLPLAHIGGLAVVMRSLHTGTPLEVHDGFDADHVLDAAARGATLVSLVTRTLNRIPADAFRTILIGGAAPPPDRPPNVIATYGMTETGSGVVYEHTALDGLEIDLAPVADHGEQGPPSTEIRLRGPMLFRGYRSGPDPFDDDGWFPTGDLGHRDAHGHLVVEGRRGDVIVTGGEKVWPEPVERWLTEHEGVAEVALVGRPDPDWGHRVTALLVPADPERPVELAELRRWTVERFPSWCAPKEVVVRDTLPRTSLGKLRRNLL